MLNILQKFTKLNGMAVDPFSDFKAAARAAY